MNKRIWIYTSVSVLAIVCFVGTAPANTSKEWQDENLWTRTFQWGDLEFEVKSGCGLGPGPNCWRDTTDFVWVDSWNRLHLTLKQGPNNLWYSTEVRTTGCAEYGDYRIDTVSYVDNLPARVVYAAFIYESDTQEIDIFEHSRWGDPNFPTNSQFALQPAIPANLERFTFSQGGAHTYNTASWNYPTVDFGMYNGLGGIPFHTWSRTSTQYVPDDTQCPRFHLNVWAYQGVAPSGPVELVIDRVRTPMGDTSWW